MLVEFVSILDIVFIMGSTKNKEKSYCLVKKIKVLGQEVAASANSM